MAISTAQQSSTSGRFAGLDPEQLIRAFRLMHTARRLDDREIALKRQNRIFFQISGAGHKAIQVAAGMSLRPGHDRLYLYYRDRALCLTTSDLATSTLPFAASPRSTPGSATIPGSKPPSFPKPKP